MLDTEPVDLQRPAETRQTPRPKERVMKTYDLVAAVSRNTAARPDLRKRPPDGAAFAQEVDTGGTKLGCPAEFALPAAGLPRKDRRMPTKPLSAFRYLTFDVVGTLIDFEREILLRRPNDWDGTLLGKGDVHPTGGENNVFTEDNLKKCGYALRNIYRDYPRALW